MWFYIATSKSGINYLTFAGFRLFLIRITFCLKFFLMIKVESTKPQKKTVQVKCAGVFLRIKLKGIYWIVKSKESLLSTVLNCKSKGPVLRKRVATCWLNLPLFEGDKKSTKTLKTWLEVACLIKVPFLEASELLLWKGVWIS